MGHYNDASLSQNSEKGDKKKRNNGRHTAIKMFLWGLIGAIIGLLGTTGFHLLNQSGMGSWINQYVYQVLLREIFWVQILVTLALLSVQVYYFVLAKKGVSRFLKEAEEEQLDSIEKAFDHNLNLSLTLGGVLLVLNFVFLGLALDDLNGFVMGSVVVFLAASIMTSLLEIKSIRLIQRKDPQHVADPASKDFSKQWLETCDEAERTIIYKSAYTAYTQTKFFLLFMMLVTLLTKVTLDTGNYPLLIVACLMLFHGLSYNLAAIKLSKSKITL